MFRRFGAEVSVVQRVDRLLPAEESAVAEAVTTAFESEGTEVVTGSGVTGVRRSDDGLVVVEHRTGEIVGSHLLLAAGRTPNTAGLGLAEAGVEVDERGFVAVDYGYATRAEGVYAIGDVVGPPMFTHTARDDAALVSRHLFQGEDISSAHRLVPHAVFTDPLLRSHRIPGPRAVRRWSLGGGGAVQRRRQGAGHR